MKPHRTDGISLSFGLIFMLIAAWWAVTEVLTVRLPAGGWLVAGVLILFGVLGLIGAIRSGRRAEVPAPVAAEARVETPSGLPPQMHADIVRELLENPVDRVDLPPAPPSAPAFATDGSPAPGAATPPAGHVGPSAGSEPVTGDARPPAGEAGRSTGDPA